MDKAKYVLAGMIGLILGFTAVRWVERLIWIALLGGTVAWNVYVQQ